MVQSLIYTTPSCCYFGNCVFLMNSLKVETLNERTWFILVDVLQCQKNLNFEHIIFKNTKIAPKKV